MPAGIVASESLGLGTEGGGVATDNLGLGTEGGGVATDSRPDPELLAYDMPIFVTTTIAKHKKSALTLAKTVRADLDIVVLLSDRYCLKIIE